MLSGHRTPQQTTRSKPFWKAAAPGATDHWSGFLAKIFTGNHGFYHETYGNYGFARKTWGLNLLKFSHHPILWTKASTMGQPRLAAGSCGNLSEQFLTNSPKDTGTWGRSLNSAGNKLRPLSTSRKQSRNKRVAHMEKFRKKTNHVTTSSFLLLSQHGAITPPISLRLSVILGNFADLWTESKVGGKSPIQSSVWLLNHQL